MAQKLRLPNTVLQLKLNMFQPCNFDYHAKLNFINNGFFKSQTT